MTQGTTVRPQDDLFAAVNADWTASTEIPDDQSIHGAIHELRDAAEDACRTIIEQCAAAPGAPGGPSQLIGDLWTSFMDVAAVEERGFAPIADDLAKVRSLTDVVGFLRLLGELQTGGVSGVFGYAVDNDADDPEHYLPHLYQGGLGLPDESFYKADEYAAIRTAYVGHIERALTLAGIPDAADVAADIMALETDLAAGHWDRVRSRDRSQTHNPMTYEQLTDLLPAEYWTAWREGIAAGEKALSRVEVMQPGFFEVLRTLLVDERLGQWKNWLTFKVVRSLAPYGPAALVEENFDFYGRTLSGTPQLRERWKRGVALVEGAVGEALGELYVQQHFSPTAKERMDELVGHLLAAYRHNIVALPWMTEATKERALDKLATFNPKIGYPTTFRDYAGLVIAADDLLGNVRRSTAGEWAREQDKLGTEVDRDEWFMTPQTVNAYYNPGMNEIVFPAAILQAPFFDPSASDAVNFGGIGAVIGHEIGHGFDDQGSKYDGTGALKDWWTGDDRAAFEALTGRLIAQYDALSPAGADGRHVNGSLTIGENIGDLGGLGIAFQAWRMAAGIPDGDPVDATQAQAFFANWARAWRTKTRPEEVQRRLALDPHSPPEFRCNQVVRNLDEFYAAFDVQPDDELWLDPAERVRIW
ncbi:peptidase M13 [Nakamurella sp. YIM 132087]|uniref:Peptidase M13 n=1 Tax=Nakamurella alba TaxID=2665158 RepID=A0A7K1FNP2_9ACTN|nr:M13-type metalloendopeptidase [Nakamurella alba]MTD15785.1 peptidase M13 [Nakamurella alba]